MKKESKKHLLNLIVAPLMILITLKIILRNNEMSQIIQIFRNLNVFYMLLAILCMLIYWILESGMISVLVSRFTGEEYTLKTFWTSIKTTLIGQYYSNITPFASGGQPVQLYIMKKDGISLSNGTAVLVSKFLLFQIGVTIYCIAFSLIKLKWILSDIKSVSYFILVGAFVNLAILTLVLMLVFKPNLLSRIIYSIIGFLKRINIIKDEEGKKAKVNKFIEEYSTSIKKLKENKKLTLFLFLVTFVQLTAFFSITFFIYKALGLTGVSVYKVIALQAILYIAVYFAPTPGTAGASELGFSVILGTVFTKDLLGTALILWRGVSYYFSLIFCGVFSVLITLFDKKKKKKIVA